MCQDMWIDQICIDQDDMKERSHQVKMMAPVYKGAQRVIAWLTSLSQRHGNFDDLEVERPMIKKDLVSHPIFTRTWIIQETMLAKEHIFLYHKGTLVS